MQTCTRCRRSRTGSASGRVRGPGKRLAVDHLGVHVAVCVCARNAIFLMPETNPANILYWRTRRLRKATGERRLKNQSEIDAAEHTARDHLIVLGRAFTLTLFESIVFLLDLCIALLYGLLYMWFESFPLVFGGIYGFNIGQQGSVFLGIFVASLTTVPCYLLRFRGSASRGDSSSVDIFRSVCPSDLVWLGVPSKYSLDCSYCGFQFLYRWCDHPVQRGAYLSGHGISSARGVSMCRQRSLSFFVWYGISTILW